MTTLRELKNAYKRIKESIPAESKYEAAEILKENKFADYLILILLQIFTLEGSLTSNSISALSFITSDSRIKDSSCLTALLDEYSLTYNEAKMLLESDASKLFSSLELIHNQNGDKLKELLDDFSLLLYSVYKMQPISASHNNYLHGIWSAISSAVKVDVSSYMALYPSASTANEDADIDLYLEKLDSLIGLDYIKADVHKIVNMIKVNNSRLHKTAARW